jgi:glycosyltransferase involved in cell wall biosynthesis
MPKNPEISIIICTYNRAKFLPGALNSLVKQTLEPSRFEILIINNNSTDNTETISKNFLASNPKLKVKYFLEAQKGLSAARNRGIKESSCNFIIFIDDDADVTENYLEVGLNFFENNPGMAAFGGKIIPVYEDGNEPEWMSKPLWGLVTKADWGNKIGEYPKGKRPYGCSMAFRKNVFKEIGLFNSGLLFRSEDKYIFTQLETHNKMFLYNPEFIVYHHIDNSRTTFESFKKMSLGVGRGEHDRLINSGVLKNILKVVEYIIKFLSTLAIAAVFLLRLEFKKADYLIRNRWYVLIGYFIK